MRISIIGTGYVGLTTGVVLAYLGNQVTCIDVDQSKIEGLNNSILPIYEPYLNDLYYLAKNNLAFTSNYCEALPGSEIIFITVDTPTTLDGRVNLESLKNAVYQIGKNLGSNFTVIVNKSTVPIGCGKWVEELLKDIIQNCSGVKQDKSFSVVSNPEFLREGNALIDTFYPERIVIGTDNKRALERLREVYVPIIQQTFTPPSFMPQPTKLQFVPLVSTDIASAELIKYAANSFLALKVSFINEIACISEKVGADILKIAEGIGYDKRIGIEFLNAGIGWGGSCLGKDTAALLTTAKEYGLTITTIEAARTLNYQLRKRLVDKLLDELKILKGKTIGILGLTFKPHTDDLRDAPAIDIIKGLCIRGAKLIVHDPAGMEKFKKNYSDLTVNFALSPENVFEGADAVGLITEWPQYREINWSRVGSLMRNRLIYDGRNFLNKEEIGQFGFKYIGVGR
jgi:UDPglucose 6-dehydrogenase